MAADHGGFELKEDLRARLAAAVHDIVDFGPTKLDPEDAWDYVMAFVAAEFSQDARHLRRLAKVAALEAKGRDKAATSK
jgi:ribose 5-phosphate isomerase RpiB